MSASAAAAPYDPVFDAQKHYRTLLDCTARPGTIGQFNDVALEIPRQLNRATALLALTLLSADSTFCLVEDEDDAAEFLRRQTLAASATAEKADFVFLADARRTEAIDCARTGTLAFPEQGATLIVQVAGLSPAPMPGALRVALTGPGIEIETVVFVSGSPEALFEALGKRNEEFPLGIDAYLTCDSLSAGPCVLALPRTTHIRCERV